MAINFDATKAEKTDPPSDLLMVAERQLERAVLRLQSVIDEVEAGRFDQLAEAKRVTDNLTSFIRLFMDERNKVDKLRKSFAGAVGATELDFSAARDEVGRRLALLRDAGGH
jgi:HAMP domain-containing protein